MLQEFLESEEWMAKGHFLVEPETVDDAIFFLFLLLYQANVTFSAAMSRPEPQRMLFKFICRVTSSSHYDIILRL